MKHQDKTDARLLEEQHQREKELLAGITPRVKAIKALIQEVPRRKTDNYSEDGSNSGKWTYAPKEVRLLTESEKVRKDLMSDPTIYFGQLDTRVPRIKYEYASLNKRQRETISKLYPWMVEELEDDAVLPSMIDDQWYSPISELIEKLSPKEQENITSEDRFIAGFYEELRGEDPQPMYLSDNGEVRFITPILKSDPALEIKLDMNNIPYFG